MSFNTNWNVEKYKCEHESDEHWQLRKTFIETHKNNYPEDKLVCLARVFFNVEFLGCRYPEKTMKLIEDLSREVAAEHREKQKNKLKRTFVQASDAAEAKAKRSSGEPPNKAPKTTNQDTTKKDFQYSCFVHADLVKPDPIVDTGDFPGFIIFENCNSLGKVETCPINILTMSSNKSKKWNSIVFDFPTEKNKANQAEKLCEIKLNNKLLSSGTGGTVKEAKLNAAIEGLNILRKTCYTIQAKRAFFSENPSISKDGAAQEMESRLPQDNIGSKMMQRMGWTGSGLGKKQQGIQDPIKAAPQIMQRSGFGQINQREFQERFRKVFKDYIASDSDTDLVFAPDFSSDERKVLHKSNDDTEGKDLFDIGYDEENSSAMTEQNSDEENSSDNNQCVVCYKLNIITGQERDDHLYDLMWGTNVDSTGLVLTDEVTDNTVCDMDLSDSSSENNQNSSLENSQNNLPNKAKGLYGSKQIDSIDVGADNNFTDNMVCDMDLSNNSSVKSQDNASNQSEVLLKRNEVSNIFYNKEFSSQICKSSLGGESNGIFYVLPNGSVSNISVDYVKSNHVLNKLTLQSGRKLIPGMKMNITENDMSSITGLREILLNYPNFKSSFDNTNLEQSLQKQSGFNETINNQVRKTFTSNTEGNFAQKLKIFLPDGSYKRIGVEQIQKSRELAKFTNYTPGEDTKTLKNHVTISDLRSNKAIRDLFSDFFVTCKPLDGLEENKHINPNRKNSNNQETSCKINSFSVDDSQSMDSECTDKLGDLPKDGKNATRKSDDIVSVNDNETSSCVTDHELNPNKDLYTKFSENITSKKEIQTNKKLPYYNIHNNSCNDVNQLSVRNKRAKMRIFLPDGSFKRLFIRTMMGHKELFKDIIRKRFITEEDFIINPGLCEFFPEYIAAAKVNTQTKSKDDYFPKHRNDYPKYSYTPPQYPVQYDPICERPRTFNDFSESHESPNCPNPIQQDNNHIKDQKQIFNSNINCNDSGEKVNMINSTNYKQHRNKNRSKYKIYFPDGSFKRIRHSLTERNIDLQHLKPDYRISLYEMNTNKALRELFYSRHIQSSGILKTTDDCKSSNSEEDGNVEKIGCNDNKDNDFLVSKKKEKAKDIGTEVAPEFCALPSESNESLQKHIEETVASCDTKENPQNCLKETNKISENLQKIIKEPDDMFGNNKQTQKLKESTGDQIVQENLAREFVDSCENNESLAINFKEPGTSDLKSQSHLKDKTFTNTNLQKHLEETGTTVDVSAHSQKSIEILENRKSLHDQEEPGVPSYSLEDHINASTVTIHSSEPI